MHIQPLLALGARVIALAAVHLVCFGIAAGLTLAPVLDGQPAAEGAQAAVAGLPLVILLNTAVLAYVALRSRWHGFRLATTLALVYYGVYTVLPYIEVAAFPPVVARMPPGMLPASFAMGAILSALVAPAAVLLLGRWKPDPVEEAPGERLVLPAREWAWRLAAIAAAYLVLYFAFGYYVAWRSPAVQAYYGGRDPGTFAAQMAEVMRTTPWMPIFQVFRALLWTAFALPVIRMMRGDWWEAGLAVALLFAVPMNSGHLLPNPIMPDGVRIAHLLETAPSNFIFGWVVVGLLHWRPSATGLSAAPGST